MVCGSAGLTGRRLVDEMVCYLAAKTVYHLAAS
jgi:hypothetical protein